jgi:hypothetical protein
MHEHIVWIDNAIAEGKESRQGVARYGRKEKVQGDAPSGPGWEAGPRLDDRPPEQNAGGEKARLFQFMQPHGTHAQFEQTGNVPCDDGCRTGEPTEHRLCHQAPKRLYCGATQ